MAQQRPENRAEETGWNTLYSWIHEWKQGFRLNQVPLCPRHRWRIDGHQTGADQNQPNRSEQPDGQAAHGPMVLNLRQ